MATPTLRALPISRAADAGYWLAWLATVTFFAGFYALLVPLTRYLEALGLQDWQIGFILGMFGVAALIARPLSGLAVDRFGARPTMLVGAGALGAGALLVPETASFAALAGLRVLQAIGYVAFTTGGTALVVSLTTPAERAGRLAAFGAAANVAIALAPAAMTALLVFAPVAVGLLATAACACLAGLVALLVPAIPTASNQVEARTRLLLVPPRRVWLPMLVTGLLGAGFAAFFQFAPILADRRGVATGLLYTSYGVVIIVTRLFGTRFVDCVPARVIVAVAAVLMAAAYALIASGPPFGLLLAGIGLVGASGGLFHPVLLAHHAALLPGTPGRASAAFYIAFDLGIGVGSWLFGIMLQVAGVSGMYWLAAASAVVALPLALRLASRS
jgi:predicted MFS family arabinose efflux permease